MQDPDLPRSNKKTTYTLQKALSLATSDQRLLHDDIEQDKATFFNLIMPPCTLWQNPGLPLLSLELTDPKRLE